MGFIVKQLVSSSQVKSLRGFFASDIVFLCIVSHTCCAIGTDILRLPTIYAY